MDNDQKKRVRILISYNPYIEETSVRVEYRKLAGSNLLNEIAVCGPMSGWINNLPDLLAKQYDNRRIFLAFKGTQADFEQLQKVLPQAGTSRKDHIILKHYNVHDQEYKRLVAQDSASDPYNEESAAHIQTTKKDLEICVIATMSAGKSTLINAILGTRLMPSTQEACTAIIVKIRDDDSFNGQGFTANIKDKDGTFIKKIDNLTLADMHSLNRNTSVSQVEITGDIECVPSDNISLVLVDTPGPNNARDQSHRKIQQDQLSTLSDSLVLFVLTGEFGNDDEYVLLQHVIQTISEGSQRDEDRFLFVLNKVDERKREDGSLENTLKELREYLQNHGIKNPRIFPISALLGLQIRRLMNIDPDFSEDDLDEVESKIRKFNRNPDLHLEKYAAEFSGLPEDIIAAISNDVAIAEKSWLAKGGAPYSCPHSAFIHSGIPVLEAVFMDYIRKYAMKDVFISYNPFNKRTEIKINDEYPQENSELRNLDGKLLQNWIDDLPKMLKKETKTDMFGIKFHGFPLDYEDLIDVAGNPQKKIHLAYLEFLPPKNASETTRPQKIEQVFNKIQSADCPFPELQTEKLINAYNNAKNPLFNIYVVSAARSTGKSTLVNVLLEQNLMPCGQDGGTKVITAIQDNDEMAGKPYIANVYSCDSDNPHYYDRLTPKIMQELNSDKNVRKICAMGEVSFVESTLVSMVLIDTPPAGVDHCGQFQEIENEILDDSAKPLVLYILTDDYKNDSDLDLLTKIAELMKNGKGELRDRFLFVVNKLDDRSQEDGKIKDFMESVEKYLNELGIDTPQLFPVSALSALNIQNLLNDPDSINETEQEDIKTAIRKINRRMHLEKLHTLPRIIKREIDAQLKDIKHQKVHSESDLLNDAEEAFLHTGIPSLEAIIRQYVEKYTYPERIKQLADTFMGEVEAIERNLYEKLNLIENSIFKDRKDNIAAITEERQELLDRVNWLNSIKKEIEQILSI